MKSGIASAGCNIPAAKLERPEGECFSTSSTIASILPFAADRLQVSASKAGFACQSPEKQDKQPFTLS
jgi:hypothetical protein